MGSGISRASKKVEPVPATAARQGAPDQSAPPTAVPASKAASTASVSTQTDGEAASPSVSSTDAVKAIPAERDRGPSPEPVQKDQGKKNDPAAKETGKDAAGKDEPATPPSRDTRTLSVTIAEPEKPSPDASRSGRTEPTSVPEAPAPAQEDRSDEVFGAGAFSPARGSLASPTEEKAGPFSAEKAAAEDFDAEDSKDTLDADSDDTVEKSQDPFQQKEAGWGLQSGSTASTIHKPTGPTGEGTLVPISEGEWISAQRLVNDWGDYDARMPARPLNEVFPAAARPAPPPRQGLWLDVKALVDAHVVGTSARAHAHEAFRLPRAGDYFLHYQVEGLLGRGTFTTAFEVYDTANAGESRCLKVCEMPSMQQVLDLIVLRQRLAEADPDWISFPVLHELFFAHERWVFVEERLGEDLLQLSAYPSQVNETLMRAVGVDVLEGLRKMHTVQVIHCDIKPDNIVWAPKSQKWKIIDFGHSRLEVDPWFAFREQGAGHVGHRAPEVLLGMPSDTLADVWGLGISLVETWSGLQLWKDGEQICDVCAKLQGLIGLLPTCLVQHSPYRMSLFRLDDSEASIVRQVGSQCVTLHPKATLDGLLGGCSPEFKAFVLALLEPEPRLRKPAAEMSGHPFLTKGPEPDRDWGTRWGVKPFLEKSPGLENDAWVSDAGGGTDADDLLVTSLDAL